ncbi:MAG: hypothetical protein LBG65_08115 [Puniceicoccales bacterium]|jgi:hypothetical protein|nr:hypothetical protein [Puniceicoccales bacterium]
MNTQKPDYLPNTGDELGRWLDNFIQCLRKNAPALGVPAADVDKLVAQAEGLRRIETTLSTYKQIHMAYSAIEKFYAEGPEDIEVTLPTLLSPPPGGVLHGGVQRLVERIVAAMRKSPAFTPELARVFGVAPPEARPDARLHIGPWKFKDKVLLVNWQRGRPFTAAEFFVDRGDGRGFVSNGRDHHPPVAIWDKLPPHGGIIHIKARGFVDNVPAAVESDVLEIQVPPHYARP